MFRSDLSPNILEDLIYHTSFMCIFFLDLQIVMKYMRTTFFTQLSLKSILFILVENEENLVEKYGIRVLAIQYGTPVIFSLWDNAVWNEVTTQGFNYECGFIM